ncbi:MAG: RnfABCDGE type electron transport complex subunit B [Clostridiales bacterium]|nr:RnfABCDGE type electron transport complex subunit B [Clostridiales bacterium]
MNQIVLAVVSFAVLGGVLGLLLAIASKIFHVKTDERVPAIIEALPGANCGGCGYAGCAALAEAIVKGEAKVTACSAGGAEAAAKIGEIMGETPGKMNRVRAQVMCSGTTECAKHKYVYEGVHDCIAASKLDGGDKTCPNGCLGLGTCVTICPFGAISVRDGVAYVDYHKCTGCGRCATACPKHIIKMIPFDAKHWVGCMSVDNGKTTRGYCDVGCISCKRCEKACAFGAITVNDFVASIQYDKCTGCDACAEACPRKIIWTDERQVKAVTIEKEHLTEDARGTGE